MDVLRKALNTRAEETLDPDNWSHVETLSHQIIEEAVGYLRGVRDRPVWREVPPEVKAFFASPLPRSPAALAGVYREVVENVMSYPMGNVHPRFWAWYSGSSNFTGALGDFLAAIQGSNLAGGNHAAAYMDHQVVNWCKEIVGFPASASGTLVSGGSMANIVGLTVARNAKAGIDVREFAQLTPGLARCSHHNLRWCRKGFPNAGELPGRTGPSARGRLVIQGLLAFPQHLRRGNCRRTGSQIDDLILISDQ